MKTFLFVFALLVVILSANGALHRKQLAGPPSEFFLHRLPKPIAGAVAEDSALFEANLAQHPTNKRKVVYEQDLVVDSKEAFAFAVASPHNEILQTTLKDPQGNQVNLANYLSQGVFPIGSYDVPANVYMIQNPLQGVYHLSFESQELTEQQVQLIVSETEENLVVLLWNQNDIKIYTHLNTYELHTGTSVGLVTTITKEGLYSIQGGDEESTSIRSKVYSQSSVSKAQMDVTLPDGQKVDVTMTDDGLQGDLAANDGVYGGLITADQRGVYRAKAVLSGVHVDGTPFVRTTQHLLSVVDKTLSMSGVAEGVIDRNDKNRLILSIHVTPLSPSSSSNASTTGEEEVPTASTTLYRAFAQVWGSDAKGQEIPVCWIGGLVDVKNVNGEDFVDLSLDLKWVAMSGAREPFYLKEVYLQDSKSQIPVAQSDQIVVKAHGVFAHIKKHGIRTNEITKEMRVGKNPMMMKMTMNNNMNNGTVAAEKRGLVLLHGYCSVTNPWEMTPTLFTDAYYFLNPSASIGNEEFAKKVDEFADSQGLTAYSLIGHSQGGMVSTHLLNYYFTGMDNTNNDPSKRLIQSVGTPYQGCSAAGTLASIGNSFGVGCGSNFDLSVDGAKLWLSGITNDTRNAVYYYTTTYNQGNLFGDYCSMPMNLVLQWPNDGTSELVYTTLEGANYQGNTQGWCHTTDMKYNAQYTDPQRNTLMNSLAAR